MCRSIENFNRGGWFGGRPHHVLMFRSSKSMRVQVTKKSLFSPYLFKHHSKPVSTVFYFHATPSQYSVESSVRKSTQKSLFSYSGFCKRAVSSSNLTVNSLIKLFQDHASWRASISTQYSLRVRKDLKRYGFLRYRPKNSLEPSPRWKELPKILILTPYLIDHVINFHNTKTSLITTTKYGVNEFPHAYFNCIIKINCRCQNLF